MKYYKFCLMCSVVNAYEVCTSKEIIKYALTPCFNYLILNVQISIVINDKCDKWFSSDLC